MGNLFELCGEYKILYSLLTDDSVDEQIVKDTLEAVEGEIMVKASGYLSVLNTLNMEIDACKQQKAAWEARLKVRENAVKRLKQHLLDGMQMLGKDEITTPDGVKIKVANAGGVLPIIYDSEKPVPEKYTKVTIETDGKKVREALDKGEKLDFARFGDRSKVLKIK